MLDECCQLRHAILCGQVGASQTLPLAAPAIGAESQQPSRAIHARCLCHHDRMIKRNGVKTALVEGPTKPNDMVFRWCNLARARQSLESRDPIFAALVCVDTLEQQYLQHLP